MDRKLVWLLGLVAVFNLFVFHTLGSTGFVIAALTLYTFVVLVFQKKNFPILSTVFVLLLAGAMIKSANGLVNFVAGVSILFTSVWLIFNLAANRFFAGVGEFLLTPAILLQSYILSVVDIFSAPKPKFKLMPVFRGVILAFPVMLIVLALLAGGDPVYGKFIEDLIKNIRRLITHIIVSVMLLGFFLPVTYLKLRELPQKFYTWVLPIATEINIVIGLVATVLGSFLVVQWNYVFASVAAETSLSKFGVATYSEYVKKGFIEFLMVAAIVYGLAWLGVWIKKVSPILQTILLGEFAVFIFSIFRRVALYQDYHGWTLARIYGSLFLIWVSGLMIILAWRYFSKKNLLKTELVFTAAMVLFFSWFNAEDFIYKVKPPTVNHKVDYVYLSRLSADGISGWEAAFNYADKILNDSDLDKKPLLNREDRRNIYYAYYTVNNLKNSLSEIQRHTSYKNQFDKLFAYNYSENMVWSSWKERGEKLSDLQNRFQTLNKNIYSQPTNERDWDFDISTDSFP